MSTTEYDILMQRKDKDGNIEIHYPITHLDNVVGSDELSHIGHTHTKSEVGLGNVDNTSDEDKPVSTAQQAALDLKADQSGLEAHESDDIIHLQEIDESEIDSLTVSGLYRVGNQQYPSRAKYFLVAQAFGGTDNADFQLRFPSLSTNDLSDYNILKIPAMQTRWKLSGGWSEWTRMSAALRDYFAAKSSVEALYDRFDLYANALLGTASGTGVTITDAGPSAQLLHLTVEGKTTVAEGTPTAANPIMPVGIGQSGSVCVTVTQGEEVKVYEIPVSQPLVRAKTIDRADELEDGVITRRMRYTEFDGTEDWSSWDEGGQFWFYAGFTLEGAPLEAICSHFTYSGNATPGIDQFGCSGGGYFMVNRNQWDNDLSSFKAWLAAQKATGTPLTLISVIWSPVTEQAQLPKMELFSPESTVTVEGAEFSCKYTQDLNKAIEEIRQAITSLGGTV